MGFLYLYLFCQHERLLYKRSRMARVCTINAASRCLADLCVPAASTYGRRQSRSAVSGVLLVPWTRTSTGQRSSAAYGRRTWNQLPTALRSPELPLSSFKRQLKTNLSVPALDSAAGCSCGCRVPSSGAVLTVQRLWRRLQMSRLDSGRDALTTARAVLPVTDRQSSLLPQHRISCRELLHVSESLSRNVRHSRTHSCNTTNAVNPLQ